MNNIMLGGTQQRAKLGTQKDPKSVEKTRYGEMTGIKYRKW